jgi:pimeloyl-ACP methyl ester carboxylesterase
VVVLHGLGRTAFAMRTLNKALRRAGFEVHSVEYPSTKQPPSELVELIDRQVQGCCNSKSRRTHIVTHSLGGLLARAYLARKPLPNLGRVVMLAPPNSGSELVDTFGEQWWFKKLLGPTATRLGTDRDSLPSELGKPDYELGIIAGNRSINPMGSMVIPGPDDGMVSVESTQLEGMTDFLTLPTDHVFMRYDNLVADEVIHFLRHGRFFPPHDSLTSPSDD